MPTLSEVLAGRRGLGEPITASVKLDGYGEAPFDGIKITHKQALDFAARITEIVAPFDLDSPKEP